MENEGKKSEILLKMSFLFHLQNGQKKELINES